MSTMDQSTTDQARLGGDGAARDATNEMPQPSARRLAGQRPLPGEELLPDEWTDEQADPREIPPSHAE